MTVLPRLGDSRYQSLTRLRRQQLLGAVRVVARDDRGVGDLLVGVGAGLAGLELDQVEDLVLAVEDAVVSIDARDASFSARLLVPAVPVLGAEELRVFRGRYGVDSTHVLTATWVDVPSSRERFGFE